jgi:antitoxin component YwqK of YwqJK toxin-antitoxin module
VSLAWAAGCSTGDTEEPKKSDPVAVAAACGPHQDGACTYFDKQGRKSLQATYKGGQLDGPWTYFYENKQVAAVGQYAAGAKVGRWTFNHPNGQKRLEGDYDQVGQRHGEWVQHGLDGKRLGPSRLDHGSGSWSEWNEGGQKVLQQDLREGVPHGIRREWDAAGRLSFEGRFAEGKRVGRFASYYLGTTEPLAQLEVQYKDDLKDGLEVQYWPNGQKKSSYAYRAGKRDGSLEDWYEDGQRSSERTYQAGKREGTWAEWYPGGTPKSDSQYRQSFRHGTWHTYYESGAAKSEEHYDMGKKVGTWATFYPDRSPESDAEYQDGKQVGVARSWYASGQPKEEMPYVAGRPHGVAKRFHENGSPNEVTTYMAGAKSGPSTSHHADGKVKEQGEHLLGSKHGAWTEWYEDGTKKGEIGFDQGVRHGPFALWHPNTKPWVRGAYRKGTKDGQDVAEPVGSWETWHASGAPATVLSYEKGKESLRILAPDGTVWVDLVRRDSGWVDPTRALAAEGQIEDGMPKGKWTVSRDEGTKVEQRTFKLGRLQGEAKTFHPTGTQKQAGSYQEDRRAGLWNAWDAEGKLLHVTCFVDGEKRWTSFEPVDAKATCP